MLINADWPARQQEQVGSLASAEVAARSSQARGMPGLRTRQGSIEPWILMALRAREGLPAIPIQADMAAPDAADTRAIWRSSTLFQNLETGR
jgi:hypothetical protein